MRVLDLFAGQLGWAKAFLARGWDAVAVDWTTPQIEMPKRCEFYAANILNLDMKWVRMHKIDFICASSPCEEFSKWGLRCFYPDPPYPVNGIDLFNHARNICEASGLPYVMENVRAAQQFVGPAINHCGPFYLWGNAVPTVLPQGNTKGSAPGEVRLQSSNRQFQ